MRTLATGGRGGGNGGDGGRGDADMWESRREGDWWLLVSPLQGSYSVLQRAATGTLLLLGTVTASYYRISSPPGRGHRRAQCAPTILGTTL